MPTDSAGKCPRVEQQLDGGLYEKTAVATKPKPHALACGCYHKVGPRSDKKVLIRMTTEAQAWGAAVVAGKTDMPLKKWTHIAGTYDGKSGEGKIYINGALDGEGKIGGNIVPNNDVLWLGRGAGPFLQGRTDEVRISNIARSEQEIQELMNKGIEGVLAVKSQDKLATTWGKLKSNLAR